MMTDCRLVTDAGCVAFFIESVVCCWPPCLLGYCIKAIHCLHTHGLLLCVGLLCVIGGVGYTAVWLYERPTSLNVKEQQVMINPWHCPRD